MKKLFLITVCLCVMLNLSAQSYNGTRLAVFTPDTKTLGGEIALPDLIAKKLATNLSTYTTFIIVDTSNVAEIRSIQRKSENAAFDQNTAIEAGRLLTAQYVIFSSIEKAGLTYSLSCNFTNVTTAETKPVIANPKKTIDDIYSNPGCAVDEITLKLCDALGISLTSNQRYVLMHGESDLSAEDQLKMQRDDIENFQRQMNNFDSQIAELKMSTDLSVVAEREKMEADRAMMEEKLRSAQEKEQRLLEETKKREEDAIRDAERDAEQKRKRDDMEKQAEEKIRKIREGKMENESLLSRINVIESKKKVLVEIREDVEARVDESKKSLEAEKREKVQEIRARPYRSAEKDGNGNPIASAKNMRNEEINAKEKEYDEKMEKAENNFRAAIQKQEIFLEKEIRDDYKIIAKVRTLTTTSDRGDLRYSVGTYNGESRAWENVSIFVYSDGIALAQHKINLKYSDLTGETKIPTTGGDAYNAYLDKVDLYNSWFSRGSPILTFELDYYITPYPDNCPSQYEFHFTEMRVKDTLTGKVLYKDNELELSSIGRTMNPMYDIRPIEEQKRIEAKKQFLQEQQRQKQENAEQKKIENERKKIAREQDINSRSDRMRYIGVGVSPISFSFPSSSDGRIPFGFERAYFDANITFGKVENGKGIFKNNRYFFGFSLGVLKTPDNITNVVKNLYMFDVSFLTLGCIFPLSGVHSPNIYASCGMGLFAGKTYGTWIHVSTNKDTGTKKEEKETSAAYRRLNFSLGLDFPVTGKFGIFTQMNYCLVYSNNFKGLLDIQIGISIF